MENGLLKTEDLMIGLGLTRGQIWRTIRLARTSLEPFIKERRGRGQSGGLWWAPEVIDVLRELRAGVKVYKRRKVRCG